MVRPPLNCRTMAHIHTFVVRTAVKAGMYTLPTRDNFLKSLGEAGARACTGSIVLMALGLPRSQAVSQHQ